MEMRSISENPEAVLGKVLFLHAHGMEFRFGITRF
jgi:hypothetical protein